MTEIRRAREHPTV